MISAVHIFRVDLNKHMILVKLFSVILSMFLFYMTDLHADSVLVLEPITGIDDSGGRTFTMSRHNLATGDKTLLKTFYSPYDHCGRDCSFVDEYNGKFYIGGPAGFAIYDVETNEVTLTERGSLELWTPDLWNGDTIIKRADDGSLHIGENSLVTKEENGKQSLSAQDANGDAIDINITNGSNLLINGKPTASIKEVRKYDSRSVALSAALTSLPTQSIDGSHACGIGSGVRGNYSAMALGCAAGLDKIKLFDNAPLFIRNASINLGTSFLTHDDPDYTFKAGLTWNFGKPKAKARNLSKNDRRDIRSTIAEQKNALAINKLQKDNRVLKELNMELTRKLNSLIAANQRFVSLASKMELLAQQIESSELVLASK